MAKRLLGPKRIVRLHNDSQFLDHYTALETVTRGGYFRDPVTNIQQVRFRMFRISHSFGAAAQNY